MPQPIVADHVQYQYGCQSLFTHVLMATCTMSQRTVIISPQLSDQIWDVVVQVINSVNVHLTN